MDELWTYLFCENSKKTKYSLIIEINIPWPIELILACEQEMGNIGLSKTQEENIYLTSSLKQWELFK